MSVETANVTSAQTMHHLSLPRPLAIWRSRLTTWPPWSHLYPLSLHFPALFYTSLFFICSVLSEATWCKHAVWRARQTAYSSGVFCFCGICILISVRLNCVQFGEPNCLHHECRMIMLSSQNWCFHSGGLCPSLPTQRRRLELAFWLSPGLSAHSKIRSESGLELACWLSLGISAHSKIRTGACKLAVSKHPRPLKDALTQRCSSNQFEEGPSETKPALLAILSLLRVDPAPLGTS